MRVQACISDIAVAAKSPLPSWPLELIFHTMYRRHGSTVASALPALGLLGLASLAGLTFALWMENGAAIFMALVESGMSWCF